MRISGLLTAVIFLSAITSLDFAQPAPKPAKVAVFVPLYVDDVFHGSVYSLGKAGLPKSILPGLEFYNGVMLAVDSMNADSIPLQMNIYDTKDSSRSLDAVLNSGDMNDVGLIIAVITNVQELKAFSEAALKKNIPLISATYPNYLGVSDNPYFVLLNTSFQAHVQALYKYLQKHFAAGNITAISKQGGTEAFVKNYINELNKGAHSTPLKIKWLSVDENYVSINHLAAELDSTKPNVVFVASPGENFGAKIFKILCGSPYQTTLIGMPTWDGIKELEDRSCHNVQAVFTTPFLFYSQNKTLAATINQKYKEKYFSRPSDMVYKGFEATYHFTRLLLKHGDNLANNLSDKSFTLFNQFDLKPIRLKKTSQQPDLLENRKLYFIKKQQGTVKVE